MEVTNGQGEERGQLSTLGVRLRPLRPCMRRDQLEAGSEVQRPEVIIDKMVPRTE